MKKLNRDVVIATLTLAGCGLLGWQSLNIRDPGYGTLAPAAWPQFVLVLLTVFSLIYFFQSITAPATDPVENPAADAPSGKGFGAFFEHYRNPIICYGIYFAFLLTLPVLGALIGGILLVFLLLNVLGGWSPGALVRHGLIAIISMGFMWSLFSFGLRVILPEGMIFTIL